MSDSLTSQAWEALLARLGSPAEYETTRRKLVKFFDWRGALGSEDLTDIVIDRVARKLAQGEQIVELSAYFYSVAKLVLLEGARRQARVGGEMPEQLAAPEKVRDGVSDCFTQCLSRRPADVRRLILDYYEEDKSAKVDHRKVLAERLGIQVNALRIRVCRIRAELEQCIRQCEAKLT